MFHSFSTTHVPSTVIAPSATLLWRIEPGFGLTSIHWFQPQNHNKRYTNERKYGNHGQLTPSASPASPKDKPELLSSAEISEGDAPTSAREWWGHSGCLFGSTTQRNLNYWQLRPEPEMSNPIVTRWFIKSHKDGKHHQLHKNLPNTLKHFQVITIDSIFEVGKCFNSVRTLANPIGHLILLCCLIGLFQTLSKLGFKRFQEKEKA